MNDRIPHTERDTGPERSTISGLHGFRGLTMPTSSPQMGERATEPVTARSTLATEGRPQSSAGSQTRQPSETTDAAFSLITSVVSPTSDATPPSEMTAPLPSSTDQLQAIDAAAAR